MNERSTHGHPARTLSRGLMAALLLSAMSAPLIVSAQTAAQQKLQRTPTETVREFYKALRERRFREAFALSIYKPAIDGLSREEFEDLRPDFDRMGAAIPDKVEISGEQISSDTATVFVKILGDETGATAQAEPISLMRTKGGEWIVGDPANEKIVQKDGKEFFFKARINTHHTEVRAMMQRIMLAEVVYGKQHNGQFADLSMLINAGLIPKDIEATESTGYRFHITLAPDRKSYTAGAEPARYNRTGRYSFYLDNKSGIQEDDVGGKPLVPSPKKD
ncbi:MAG TPA: hypothetical protein VF708_20595 [Pyrinomonadaceae bacterium]|jgi:hypothetical protein